MTTEYQHFGKYELHKRISRNTNGEFWKGYDPELQRTVAIKVYYIDQVDATFISRFAQRVGVLTSIHHPNIVSIQDFYIAPSKNSEEASSSAVCIVMDYIEAPTLADYIHSTSSLGRLPPGADILHLFTSLSLAIDYAHQNGIMHGHIKPSSILLGKNTSSQNKIGEPWLIDFELSGILQNSSSSFEPYYLAPEQVRGYPANERSDVYTLGIILYELCTGVLPFRGNRRVAIMMQHINALPTPPALLNPTISPALTNVIMRSLAKDPEIRFASASSMAVALAKALNMPVPENLVRSAYLLELLSDSDVTRPNSPVVVPRLVQPPRITSQVDRSTIAQNSWPWSGTGVVEAVKMPEKSSRDHAERDHSSVVSSHPTPITPIPPMEPFPFMHRRHFYKIWIIILIIFILLSGIITVGAIFFSSWAGPFNS